MRVLRLLACATPFLAAVACGSRTGLLVWDDPSDAQGTDAGDATDARDATVDAHDAGPDALEEDVTDAPLDIADVRDVAVDVTIDVGRPPPIGCEDAGATLIYVITQQGDLWSLYPPTVDFKRIGLIDCRPIPAMPPATPFSMAVDHGGTAYVVYSDGELFRVSTATARCQPTAFARNQSGFHSFGMGFSQNPSGVGETLFVASDVLGDAGPPPRLGAINTTSLVLRTVAFFQPPIDNAELTGTGAGDLFAFFALSQPDPLTSVLPPPSAIARIDKVTGSVGLPAVLKDVGQGCGWAFATWGGDFYTFTATPPAAMGCTQPWPTQVTRFRPSDQSVTSIPTPNFKEEIVGAGVSTCAPQQ